MWGRSQAAQALASAPGLASRDGPETVGISRGCQGLPCVYQRSKHFIDGLNSHSRPMRLAASPSLVPVLQIRRGTGLAQGGTVHSRSVTWTRLSVFRVLTLNITLKITL